MSSLRARHFPSELIALGGVVLVQLLIDGWIRRSGFLAVSDDDYARVVIAQKFVEAPTWDPSGTSWLPFPFLHMGAAMKLFSPSLAFARTWSLVASCGATLLLFMAARQWQVRISLAFTAACLGALLPYAAYLSAATVPEYLTAALLVFALATLAVDASDTRAQWTGGVCLFLATASRYEVWPAAVAFSAIRLRDATRVGSFRPLGSAVLALCFPLLWMVHGLIEHGNAFFFVKRVTDYKDALGSGTSGGVAAFRYLEGLLLAEPETIFVSVGLAALVAAKGSGARILTRLLYAWLTLGLLFLVLLASALKSGAPTHHEERALLPIWLFSVLSCAALIEHGGLSMKHARVALFLGVGFGFGLRQSDVFQREAFTDRKQEEALGERLRTLTGAETRIALQMEDYGYFAVMAAAGDPQRFEILDTHDPRAQSQVSPLLARYRAQGGCLFVEPKISPLTPGKREVEKFSRWSIRQFENCSLSAEGGSPQLKSGI